MAKLFESEKTDTTQEELEFFNRYVAAFGKAVKAEMKADPKKCEYHLTVTNEYGDTLSFNEMSSGYNGEGCRGTQQVLEKCGFNVEPKFVQEHIEFLITK